MKIEVYANGEYKHVPVTTEKHPGDETIPEDTEKVKFVIDCDVNLYNDNGVKENIARDRLVHVLTNRDMRGKWG